MNPLLRRVHLHLPALRGERLVVGFSGGRDSVALLSLLHELQPAAGFELAALHVNHGLSPNAGRWQEFCEAFCAARQIALDVVRLQLDRQGGQSLEALARDGRYRAFAAIRGNWLALAHHRDDQAETFLLQAMRGAGPFGLAAMPLQRQLAGKQLLRPLLDSSRADIETWLASRQLSWVDDESNSDRRYRRNALRHNVMPALEAVQAGAAAALARAAGHCAEASQLLRELAEGDGHPHASELDVTELAALSAPRARNLLRSWLFFRGVRLPSRVALDEFLHQVLHAAGDRQPQLPLEQGTVRRFAGRLYWVSHWQARDSAFVWRGESSVLVAGWQGTLHIEQAEQGLDGERLHGRTIEVCLRRGGERLEVHAQRPSQSLKNLFQQSGIAPWERERWPLLRIDGQLLAVPGLGISAAWQHQPGVQLRWSPA